MASETMIAIPMRFASILVLSLSEQTVGSL